MSEVLALLIQLLIIMYSIELLLSGTRFTNQKLPRAAVHLHRSSQNRTGYEGLVWFRGHMLSFVSRGKNQEAKGEATWRRAKRNRVSNQRMQAELACEASIPVDYQRV